MADAKLTIEVVDDTRPGSSSSAEPHWMGIAPPTPTPVPMPTPAGLGSGAPVPMPLPAPVPMPAPAPAYGGPAPMPVPMPTPAPVPMPTPAPVPMPTPAPAYGGPTPAAYGGPTPAPAFGGPSGVSAVPAFDRPIPVIIMGPRPVPVTMTGGPAAKPTGMPKPKMEPGWASRLFRNAGMAARGAGTAAAGAASNQGMPGFQVAVTGATNALSALGPKGQAAGAGIQAVAQAVTAFKTTIDAFVARGKELSGYSGSLSAASATAEVRKLVSDVREANKLGDQYAKLIDAQSKNEAILSELFTYIKGPIIEVVTRGLETANRTLVGILEGINKLTGGLVPGLKDLIADLKKILAGDPAADLDKLIADFLKPNIGMPIPPPVGMPPIGGGIGIPLAIP